MNIGGKKCLEGYWGKSGDKSGKDMTIFYTYIKLPKKTIKF